MNSFFNTISKIIGLIIILPFILLWMTLVAMFMPILIILSLFTGKIGIEFHNES